MTKRRERPDLPARIEGLIEKMSECREEASNLKLPLIHYFLDMAAVELRNQHPLPVKEGEVQP